MAKLITYYDESVVKEQDFLQSLNNKLAELRQSPQKHSDVDGFQANISLKQEAIQTKLEKRRANKIEKLWKPTGEQHQENGVDPKLPKKGRKNKKKQNKPRNKSKRKNKPKIPKRIRVIET